MNVLKTFASAEQITKADIRTIRKAFEISVKGNRISLTAEELKDAAKKLIGISSTTDVIQIKHLVSLIELINTQTKEVDKKIEEFSYENNYPILSIPGIYQFSSTSILAELGNIRNYANARKIIKFTGVVPLR